MAKADEMNQCFDSMRKAAKVLYERCLANQGNEQVDWDKVRKNIAIGTEALCTAIDSLPATKKEPSTTTSSYEFLTAAYHKASDLSMVMYMLYHPLEGNWDTSTLVLLGELFYTSHKLSKFQQHLHRAKDPNLTLNYRQELTSDILASVHSLASEDWEAINSLVKGYFKKVNELQLDQHKVLDDIMDYERKSSNE